ncbi:MAG: UDP-N-acetylmuramoyl-L-alanyl-D-glutamate--2,6-diaminopimelate ligase [Anaerolineales bacterium]|nr:UDP-N-acetylmuramoyl-L-alanyl-D-glutamate--2,6-diaminopimelate ligase [Anaerolineales bacterium]MCW5855180.1 UDP-N-acetylmuramoyl-L-alanyl-D-glutamate--2,6-diaminopimelate ligase [Anaerolineales bacterium]
MLNLSELLGEVTNVALPDVQVGGLALDSRLVKPGDVFFAIVQGVDRYQFLDEVLARGAVAVVGERAGVQLPIPHIQVADARAALAAAAAALYRYPARDLTIIGVTGTDGKTTTSNFIYQILQAAGLGTGMISTVNAQIGEQVLDTGFHVTTPEAFDTQGYLRQMADAGLSHAVLEMTSIGLAQQRGARPAEFDIGVVTNITHEHLNDHGTYEAYFDAKARLFDGLAQPAHKTRPVGRLAVLNRDDRSYAGLAARVTARQLAYGLHAEADLRAEDVVNQPGSLSFTAVGPGGLRFPVHTPMFGAYNVSNALAAIGSTVIGLGLPVEAAQQGIAALRGVPGRMERIEMGQDFNAIVDFAHTPFALIAALQAGRQLTAGKLIAVFGSAGLRDKAKRRMMAEAAAELADISVLTAEDPRTESLDGILEEMAAGARHKGGVEGKSFFRVPDRGAAISFALLQAQPGDLVIVLGKGHEQSMCFGETEYPWDDRIALRAALAEYLGVPGPEMPKLPTSG